MKKVVITGSRGFIGSNLMEKLAKSQVEIIPIDIEDGYDVKDMSTLGSIPSFDVLVHFAALSFVPHSYEKPQAFYETNVMGTLNMLELCKKNNARFIYTSSYVYGTPDYLPIDENHPIRAFNPYSQTKIMGEELCEAYNRDFNISSIIFRPFNVYGKGQGDNFLIQTILNQVKSGIIQLKDPRPKRDFIYISDLVEAYIKAIDLNFHGIHRCNLGSGVSTSIQDLTNTISKHSKTPIKVNFTNEQRPSEVLETKADISKAKELLGWQPRVNISKGINKIING
jgi:UDP-glucose 4-epimerase